MSAKCSDNPLGRREFANALWTERGFENDLLSLMKVDGTVIVSVKG